MRNVWYKVNSLALLLVLPALAHAQAKGPTRSTQATSGSGSAVIRELASAWWLWLGIIVILGLVGLLFYLRNKTDD